MEVSPSPTRNHDDNVKLGSMQVGQVKVWIW